MMETDSGTSAPPRRRLERARSHRMIAGVCEGLGRYFDVDPVIFRIGFAVAAVAGGAGVIAYIIAALVIPEEGSRRPALVLPRRLPSWVPWVLVVVGVLALFDGFDDGHHHPFGWAVLVLLGAGFLIWRHEQRDPRPPAPPVPPGEDTLVDATPVVPGGPVEPVEPVEPLEPGEPEPPRPRSILGRLTLSALLIGGGVALALAQQSDSEVTGRDVEAFLGGALLLVAAAMVVGAWWGRARPLIALGVLLTLAAGAASVVDVPLRGGVGDRRWRPLASELRHRYRLGIGDAELDLTRVDTDVTTRATVGIGHLKVIVPSDATVDVDAHAGLGELQVLGRTSDGNDLDETVHSRVSELGPDITLDVRVGVGQVEVIREAA